MKTLVIYFSHTGNTKQVADSIAEYCQADIEKIEEVRSREGWLGYFAAGRDAWRQRNCEIRPIRSNPETYDLVVVGTPVWAWNVTPAVRTFLKLHGERMKRVAFFATQGGAGAEGVFKQMAELCGQKPIATLVLTERETKRNDYAVKLRLFVDSMSQTT